MLIIQYFNINIIKRKQKKIREISLCLGAYIANSKAKILFINESL